MPDQAPPTPGAARTRPPPSANGTRPPPAAANPRHPVPRTRVSGLHTTLIGGMFILTVLVIFIVQNAHTVHLSSLGAHLALPAAVALLLAAIAGALLMAAAGTARITQLRRARRRGPPPAPAPPGR